MTQAAGGGIPLAKLEDTHTPRRLPMPNISIDTLGASVTPWVGHLEMTMVLLRQAGGYAGMCSGGSSRGPTTV